MSCTFSSESFSNLRRRNFFLFVLFAMIAILVIVFIVNSSHSKEISHSLSQRNELHELKLVHVFFRHGARTPSDTYPNDIYANEPFSPYGWGQLTNEGKNEMYELGGFLRQRYHDYMSGTMNLNEIYAQCTDVSRTKMSIQLVLASLFPPKNTRLEWNSHLNWQPIPYNYEELSKDSLLLVRTGCPRYYEELERVMKEDVGAEIKSYENMMAALTNITGLKISTPDDVQSLYNTLKTEDEYGLDLPNWTKNFYPEPLRNLTDRSFVFNAYNSILKRFRGGVFVKKVLSDWHSKIKNKMEKKIFIYAGHDSTVSNVFSAFNVWKGQHPDYATAGFLELSKHKETGQYGVEIFIRHYKKFSQLIIPGCEEFCELSKLEKHLSDNIPNNWEEECKPIDVNYTTPPPHGP